MVSQYAAALQAIPKQSSHQPFMSISLSDAPVCRPEPDFFLGSHPELTPRYAQGVALLHQTANQGLYNLCSDNADLHSAKHSHQCTQSHTASRPCPHVCRGAFETGTASSVDKLVCAHDVRDQQCQPHSAGTCQPARLANLHRPHRFGVTFTMMTFCTPKVCIANACACVSFYALNLSMKALSAYCATKSTLAMVGCHGVITLCSLRTDQGVQALNCCRAAVPGLDRLNSFWATQVDSLTVCSKPQGLTHMGKQHGCPFPSN